ncbi:MAG: amidohydrolase family protein [Candidatus Nanoarchaeia archaeon]|nr:amidohydrolase family protein [Candidatus Nanoarchaeia archaeon]
MIDFHHHLGVDLDAYLEVLSRNNIEKAVLMPYDFGELSEKEAYLASFSPLKTKEYINCFLKQLGRINEELYNKTLGIEKIIFTPWLSPECSDLSSFTHAKVVKFVPIFDNLNEDYFQRIEPLIEEAINNGAIVMIHTGWGANVQPVISLAEKFPLGKFVIAHMKEDDDSYNYWREKALALKNVYCEISYFPHPKRIANYAKKGLAEKLLFGSDFRKLEDEQTIRGYSAMVNEADMSEEQKKGIFKDNALNLLGIN